MAAETDTRSNHRVAIFVALSYAWAWALWGYWIPAMPPGGLQISAPFVICAIGGGFGPMLAAVVVLLATEGRAGVATLFRGALRWRVAAIWYAVALLLVPAVTVVSVLIQMPLFGPPVWGNPVGILPLAIGWPIMAAIGEEFGWRGFALPRLETRFGLIGACLVIGLAWGFWHLPPDYSALKEYGWWFIPAFLVNGPMVLTAHAVIMGWIWARSGRNLLLMLLYHFSITATAIAAPVEAIDPAGATASAFFSAALFWLISIYLMAFRTRDFRP